MAIEIFKFKQHDQEYISFIIPFEKLDAYSKVLVYQEDEDGYQRKPNPTHINKISKFVLTNLNTFKLPTSIILGIDKKDSISLIEKTSSSNEILKLDNIGTGIKPFRIVDGQHRILGLRKALESLTDANDRAKINQYPFNIIAILSNENERSVELEIFVDINSKGKKVSTDLAELARYNYDVKEQKIVKDIQSISEHIAMKASQELRENDLNGVWSNAIKFDIHSETNLGIIGVSAFRSSITGIIKNYLGKFEHGLIQLEGQSLIDACDHQADIIKEFISKCWNNAVKEKWSNCFRVNTVENDSEQIVSVYFSTNHYLQKPLGAKSINKLIEISVSETADLAQAFDHFQNIIKSSNVIGDTWKVGGVFSGLNSEGGFKKIREMITNDRPIPSN